METFAFLTLTFPVIVTAENFWFLFIYLLVYLFKQPCLTEAWVGLASVWAGSSHGRWKRVNNYTCGTKQIIRSRICRLLFAACVVHGNPASSSMVGHHAWPVEK